MQPAFKNGKLDHDKINDFLAQNRTKIGRASQIKELFKHHDRLTRSEIAKILNISVMTVHRYIKPLLEEGHIVKRMPTPSPASFYFKRAEKK